MACRIHDSVQRGEIDNREKGVVRGKLWVHGYPEPLVLELLGNANADLAGCLLEFENSIATVPIDPDVDFLALQRGTVGDLTASRKVREFDIPFEEAYERLMQKLPVPEHTANALYLEWFTEGNGRVVVESTDYRLKISPPSWRLSPEEEKQRQADTAASWTVFIDKLNKALAAEQPPPPEDKEWNEFDYEKLLRESDARTDKYLELLDKYEDHPDRERLIAKEMGWNAEEDEGDDAPGNPDGSASDTIEESDLADETPYDAEDEGSEDDVETAEEPPEPDLATEGVDWVRDEEGNFSHPLALRSFKSSLALWRQCEALGVAKADDDDLCRLIGEFQITSAKLAGALNSLVYGRDVTEGAFVVACLKRALNHLHLAQGALEKVASKKLLPAEVISTTRTELFAIREEILRLMGEFRKPS